MKHTYRATLFLISLIFSSSAWSLASYCADGPIGSEPHTVYHLVTLNSNDWAYGWLWVISSVSGAGSAYANETGPISGVPSGYHAYLSPGTGTHYISGSSEVGVWTTEEGFIGVGITDYCSHAANFPAPVVDAYTSPSTTVVQGTQVTLGFTASTSYGNNCYFLGVPQGTSNSNTFTAQMSDSGNYTVDCYNYFGQNSDTTSLQVLECGTNYIRQIGPNTTSPSTSYTSGQLIIGGQKLFGNTEMNWNYGSLSPSGLICALECINNEEKYIIKGSLTKDSSSYELVAEQVQADGCSGVLTRSTSNKNITAAHENIHGEAFVPHINFSNASIHVGTYSTLTSCSTAANGLLTQLDTAMASEDTDQDNHADHGGQPIQAVSCVNNQTVEFTSGTY